jgi:hypothetical protein
MKKVLVIYEMVPEDTRIYELEVSDEDLARLQNCHGALGGTKAVSPEVEKDLDWCNDFVGQFDPVMTAAGECPPHEGGSYAAIILTGFHL